MSHKIKDMPVGTTFIARTRDDTFSRTFVVVNQELGLIRYGSTGRVITDANIQPWSIVMTRNSEQDTVWQWERKIPWSDVIEWRDADDEREAMRHAARAGTGAYRSVRRTETVVSEHTVEQSLY